jgi:hypothetical protein
MLTCINTLIINYLYFKTIKKESLMINIGYKMIQIYHAFLGGLSVFKPLGYNSIGVNGAHRIMM